ncbi:MAG: hypothetical protein A2W31_16850 [Planctomycetes bacterium RBG_16_64_10]|nr:MAG: hypothetical protein A2W31_16850 [Planctomycetes bacterium RBG_16_64_10]
MRRPRAGVGRTVPSDGFGLGKTVAAMVVCCHTLGARPNLALRGRGGRLMRRRGPARSAVPLSTSGQVDGAPGRITLS